MTKYWSSKRGSKTGKFSLCGVCKTEFYTIKSRIKIGKGKYCSQKCYWLSKVGKQTWNKGKLGYKQPNIAKALKGRKLSMERRIQMSIARKGQFTGEHNPMWKGGLTSKNSIIRHSLRYYLWRKEVFERDNYTCQICSVRGSYLHADHIKPFSLHRKIRFDIDNGRTLCVPCHRKTDTYGGRVYA